jgi:pimeloyl-ACP methyl ester carboxylesterase
VLQRAVAVGAAQAGPTEMEDQHVKREHHKHHKQREQREESIHHGRGRRAAAPRRDRQPRGRPIVFLHGLSSCWLTWSRQLCSDLTTDFRLIALDLRGHGLSEKPRDGYADSRLWADDINAVIEALRLDRPVFSGWSYGPLVILDYVRHYGEERIGGIHFVAGVTKLGSDDAMAVLTPAFLRLVPGFFATEVEESVHALAALLRLCFAHEPGADELYQMLGYNLSVPAYVRQALLSRALDNDELLPTLRTPALITHGAEDAIVTPAIVEQHKAGLAHAHIDVMADAGHAPFWDDAATFNRHLREFCATL